jgi:protoporphyrinogen/coproporphyrinogen III oxidase
MTASGSGSLAPQSAETHDLVVVGAGISGLALACFARRAGLRDVVVLEAAGRPGGKVQTEWIDGFCCEWGPQGFLDNVPETLELVRDLGLHDELLPADDDASNRFIVRGGRLRKLPASPRAFLLSSVLSLPGRLRVLAEPFRPRGPEEESVAEFATRRIGREAAEVLVDAMVTGVYAGDPTRLSLPATFPRMREMEREHGSLTRAMIAKARARKRAGGDAKGAGPAGPGGVLTTLRRGMQELTDAIGASLDAGLRLRAPVRHVRRAGSGFAVDLGDGGTLLAARVALAVPPSAAAAILDRLLPSEAIAALRDIPSVRVAVVMTAYRSPHPFHDPCRGFGFLVPGREHRRILGTIFYNSTFPPHAVAGTTLLRTLVGGARAGDLVGLDDADLLAAVRAEHAELLGGDPVPDLVHVMRHDVAIPQYTLGHVRRIATIEGAVAEAPGLVVTGNGLHGIALNSCVAEAKRLAARLSASAPIERDLAIQT